MWDEWWRLGDEPKPVVPTPAGEVRVVGVVPTEEEARAQYAVDVGLDGKRHELVFKYTDSASYGGYQRAFALGCRCGWLGVADTAGAHQLHADATVHLGLHGVDAEQSAALQVLRSALATLPAPKQPQKAESIEDADAEPGWAAAWFVLACVIVLVGFGVCLGRWLR